MLGLHRIAAALALILTFTSAAEADGLRFGSRFGDHMVVQRGRPIRVWGEAAPGAVVEVRFGPRQAQAEAGADGSWAASLEALPAGGPFSLSARVGEENAEIVDVLVGDVWLCSGQSNMQMTLKDCDGGPEAADNAGRLTNLRLCSVGRRSSKTPEATAEIRWSAASRDFARDFTGVGFFFATALSSDPALKDVPIGVIDSSFGGSVCEAWVPKEFLTGFDPASLRVSLFGSGPSGLYNAMIAPLGNAPIKGVVWYQGESNADRPGMYVDLLKALVAAWRERLETPDLPFIVIQLPDWATGSDGLSWAWLREAQATVTRAIPHVALAVGINTTDGFNLHPREKLEVGRRAALLALRDAYGLKIIASGPEFKQAKPEAGAMRVTFDTAGDGLAARGGKPVRGFAVAGADGKYWYADAVIDGDAVVVRSKDVPEPATVRYAWAGVPDATLVNRSGLPAAPFRTDSISPPDADVQTQPITRHVRMKSYEATISGTGSVTSLGIGGKQFISNDLGAAGGTSVPGWLGPRHLADVREPGPGRVTCGDSEVTLLLNFGEKGMEWEITNRSKAGIKFRIALFPRVAVGERTESGSLKLARGSAILTVTGVDAATESDDGHVLEAAVGAGASKRLIFTVGDESRPSR